MIVPALIRNDGNGASPRRHSSTRTAANPRVPPYQASARCSTSATRSTMWSSSVTVIMAAVSQGILV